MSRHFHTIWCL